MKFIVSYSLPIETIEERISRFLETGGAPPEGVSMEGRWHSVSAARGWVLASTDDAKAIYNWITDWADLIEFEVDPVLNDEEVATILRQKSG